MAGNSVNRESDDLTVRINELGTRSTQLLLFLTFAIMGAATLRTAEFLPIRPLFVWRRGGGYWQCFRFFSACCQLRTSTGAHLKHADRGLASVQCGPDRVQGLTHRPQELNCADSAETDCRPQEQTLHSHKKTVPSPVVPVEVFNWQHAEKNRKHC